MKKVMFLSKLIVQAIDLEPHVGDKVALISIRCPEDDPAELKGTWRDVLYLTFHDIEGFIEERYKLFSEDDAQQIIDFVNKVADFVTTLIVNCDAGISRSAGVAKFIAELYDLEFNHEYSLYNKKVYSTLIRVYYEGVHGGRSLMV
jgi:predicted protein tyrosine phosphatase